MKGLIFNIQRFSLNDGTGIRTVIFFKGCFLSCPWCSNPESQNKDIEFTKNKTIGKWYTVEELIKEIKKDIIFYQSSGGGVTLSGGEVLMQGEFATLLLKRIKKLGINTAIETAGMGSPIIVEELSKFCDEVLFDLKIMDKNISKKLLKADIDLIKKNLDLFIKNSPKVIIRFPFIPTFTDSLENINSVLEYMKQINLNEIHILPFHQYGSHKYNSLERDYSLKNLSPPSEKEITNLKNLIEKKGFKVLVGG